MIVFSQKGRFVFAFQVAFGQFKMAVSAEGCSPRDFLRAMKDVATQRLLAAVNKGCGPRFTPLCLPGNHSGSPSIFAKSSWRDPVPGLPPPILVTRLAIHGSLTSPSCTTLLASRKPKALATSHGDNRPVWPPCHNSRKESCEISGVYTMLNAKGNDETRVRQLFLVSDSGRLSLSWVVLGRGLLGTLGLHHSPNQS